MSSSMTGATGMRNSSGMATGNVIPKGYKMGQIQKFTPEQMKLFQNMFGQVGPDSYLSRLAGGDQDLFNQIEAPAMQQFQGLQGQLASRFSGMGGLGARRSSGFQNTANQAAQDFAGQLQSQRLGLSRQALQDLMGISESLLGQRPQEKFLVNKQQPFWKQLLMGFNERGQQTASNLGSLAGGLA